MSENYTVAIIGAGPAGIAAAERISNAAPWLRVFLYEAGKNLENRLSELPTNNHEFNIINGFGGAGLYSDRKFSTFPAGIGQLDANIYELRTSYNDIVGKLQDILPEQRKTFEILKTETKNFIGTAFLSSEETERSVAKEGAFIAGNDKLYKSVVLSNFGDAAQILNEYKCLLDTGNVAVKCKHKVVNIQKNIFGKFVVNFDNNRRCFADFVLLAMGRFGPHIIENFEICKNPNPFFKPRRLEIGLRLGVARHLFLHDKILRLRDEDSLLYDPKIKITLPVSIEGVVVLAEFRTFCVCTPMGFGTHGYVVKSTDLVSGITSFSGSSSFSEYDTRGVMGNVTGSSNIGVMMRINTEHLSQDTIQKVLENCQRVDPCTFTLPMGSVQKCISFFLKRFYGTLSRALSLGTLRLLAKILPGENLQGGELTLYAPCIEGVGNYPDVNVRTYEHNTVEDLFVAGDMVGHTRGLLQSLTMGDYAAKAIVTKAVEKMLREKYILQPYQSIFLPSFEYKKTIFENLQEPDNYAKMERRLQDHFVTATRRYDNALVKEIYQNMHGVQYTGKNGDMGVLYELHHFFLDNIVYSAIGELHCISQHSMIQYIMLCNAVEQYKELLCDAVFHSIPRHYWEGNNMEECDLRYMLHGTFVGHQFKSCVLALRTRASIEKRDEFTDIPVMQSAFKIMPFSKYLRENQKIPHDTEIRFVACTCAILVKFFELVIEKEHFSLILARTKIETQEPAVEYFQAPVVEKSSLYLECHVKVIITGKTAEPVDYDIKKRVIQDLASLFEGEVAVVKDVFNVLSVSINLLKHPEHGQQFFLTYRCDTKEQMEAIRKKFTPLMENAIAKAPGHLGLYRYNFRFFTDAEFVIYDDNRDLDIPWFPEIDFLHKNWENALHAIQ